MRHIIFCVFITLLNVSCMDASIIPSASDKEFHPYIEIYNSIITEELKRPVRNIPIVFGETKANQLGLCSFHKNYSHRNYIVINKNWWYYLNENSRKELIFHELLHCEALQYSHKENTIMSVQHNRLTNPEKHLIDYIRTYLKGN